ncbi:hypothetical protein ACK8HH_15640 [Gordonia sp. LUNF6]|uniref:hypothetical protein n=1 Tax=Gordonia sp. LUNF6 TaxID=3388658 RepID=UPI00399BBAF5
MCGPSTRYSMWPAGREPTPRGAGEQAADERRDLLERVLFDVRDGTCSVLEHCYLRDVERAHGLPASVRQTPTGVGRRGFRDLERDLDAIAYGRKRTIRLGWGQTVDRPCRTAAGIGAILAARGWPGTVVRCSADCRLE